MAVIWNLIIDEEDFTRRVQKEIYQTEIIIDVERRIEGLKSLPSSADIRRQMEDFFFNDTATTEIYTPTHTLSLHDALPFGTLSTTGMM